MTDTTKTKHSDMDEHHRILAQAALFDGNFSIDWIQEMDGVKASRILSAMEKGIRSNFLARTGQGRFCFSDSKKKQEYIESLPKGDKSRFHRKAADILGKEIHDEKERDKAVAFHLLHVDNDFKACQLLIKVADHYLEALRHGDAAWYYAKAIRDLSRLKGKKEDRVFIKAVINYCKSVSRIGNTSQDVTFLKEAISRAKILNDTTSEALLKMNLAMTQQIRATSNHNAKQQFKQGLMIANESKDPILQRSALFIQTGFLFWQGRCRDVIKIYEDSWSETEKLPQSGTPLLIAISVGASYICTGQFTKGLEMLEAFRIQCRRIGDFNLSSYAGQALAGAMIEINRPDEALQYLMEAEEEAVRGNNLRIRIMGHTAMAKAYYLKNDKKQCITHLHKAIRLMNQSRITGIPNKNYLVDLNWAMETGQLPRISDLLPMQDDVKRMIRDGNILNKGIGYLYQALMKMHTGKDYSSVIHSLKLAQERFEEGGYKIGLARCRIEMARVHLKLGDEEKARDPARLAYLSLSPVSDNLFPDDLRSLVKNFIPREKLLEDVIKLGNQIAAAPDPGELVKQAVHGMNRIIGAERGGMFNINNSGIPSEFKPDALKNLTREDIKKPIFSKSLEMIKEAVTIGLGNIRSFLPDDKTKLSPKDVIRSCICSPLVLRDGVIGVLYGDHRLISDAFKESDLEILSYLSTQTALALENCRVSEEIQDLHRQLEREENLHHNGTFEIKGESPAIKRILEQIDQVGKTDATVLISGETGVGKELVARAVHNRSLRYDKPFIKVDCCALPESLIASELFGHEKGAFTGADRRRLGRFEMANNGTLFLDEIGNISSDIQVRLLRILQTREFERVGGMETLHSDFRLIAATNRDLLEDVQTGKFREDLYYRLNVFPIHIPPLRKRKEDIPSLARHLLKIHAAKMGKPIKRISKKEMDKLLVYDWPGNIREMENVIERGVILNTGPNFKVPELDVSTRKYRSNPSGTTLAENERLHILWALEKTGGKIYGPGGAAELLDIPHSTLYFRMKKFGIQKSPKSFAMPSENMV